jgi:hypothetical protein
MVGKRKMLVVLSLELLLYALIYVLALFTAFMNMHAMSEPGGLVFIGGLIFGPPGFVIIRNILRVVRFRDAGREEPGLRDAMSFATKLVIAQSVAVALTPIMGVIALTICVGLGITGLVASMGVREDPPPPQDDEQHPTT